MSTAREQAIAQVANISAMVAALELDYDRLEELEDAHAESLVDGVSTMPADELAELDELQAAVYDRCRDAVEVRERIGRHPLSIEVRSGWNPSVAPSMTPEEFRIVLCTGGPHVELQGELDQYGRPCSVRVIFKDWGESGELFGFDQDAVLTYCQQFYFGG